MNRVRAKQQEETQTNANNKQNDAEVKQKKVEVLERKRVKTPMEMRGGPGRVLGTA